MDLHTKDALHEVATACTRQWFRESAEYALLAMHRGGVPLLVASGSLRDLLVPAGSVGDWPAGKDNNVGLVANLNAYPFPCSPAFQNAWQYDWNQLEHNMVGQDQSSDRNNRWPGCVVMVGKTGCGKSTLLNNLARVVRHSRDFDQSTSCQITKRGTVYIVMDTPGFAYSAFVKHGFADPDYVNHETRSHTSSEWRLLHRRQGEKALRQELKRAQPAKQRVMPVGRAQRRQGALFQPPARGGRTSLQRRG